LNQDKKENITKPEPVKIMTTPAIVTQETVASVPEPEMSDEDISSLMSEAIEQKK
jgi:hypothetical protein